MYAKCEQTERPEKLKLMIRALSSLELLNDANAALMVLRKADFIETGALPVETERFVDIPQVVSSVQVKETSSRALQVSVGIAGVMQVSIRQAQAG